MFNKLKLTGKLMVPIVILFLLVASTLTTITNSILLSNLNKATEKEAYAVSQRCANEVKDVFSVAKIYSETLAAIVKTHYVNNNFNRDNLAQVMMSIMSEDNNIYGLFLEFEKNAFGNNDNKYLDTKHSIKSNGRFCPYVEKDNGSLTLLSDAVNEDEVDKVYYGNVNSSDETWFVSAENYDIAGVTRQMVTVFTPININGEFKGVSGVDILVDSFLVYLDKIKYFENGYFVILDENMNVVYSPEKDMITKNYMDIGYSKTLKVVEVVSTTKKTEYLKVRSKITGVMSKVTVIPITFSDYKKDWVLLLYAPLSEVYHARNTTILINILVFIVLITITSLYLISLIRKMIKPITELATVSNRIAKGDINLHVHSNSNDEIGELTQSFSSVIENIKEQCFVLSQVTRGNYSLHIKERSDYDVLSKNINIMIDSQKMMLKQMNDSIIESNKAKDMAEMASRSKSDFLSNMSHEIRTPLNAVAGMTELIIRDAISKDVLENAYHIKNACSSLLTIINDILDFSKIEAGKFEIIKNKYQVSSIVNDIVNIANIRLEGRLVDLIIDIDANIPCELIGDEVRIRQVLLNLLGNGIKFTNEGSVTLKIWHEKAEGENKIKLHCAIIDTGIGIKEENIDKLFSSFSQVDTKKNRNVEGTGLGLAISKRLLELMGGEIWVKSKYGVGSTFSFYIIQDVENSQPMGKYEQVTYNNIQNETEANIAKFTATEAKVLVVDDNLVNLMVVEGLMLPYKVKVTTATSGKQCLELIKHADFDLIFMDHMMPEMDGVETLKYIRESGIEHYKSAPIVALTANAIAGAQEAYLAEGFNDFLAKPIELKKLDKILSKYLSNKCDL